MGRGFGVQGFLVRAAKSRNGDEARHKSLSKVLDGLLRALVRRDVERNSFMVLGLCQTVVWLR